MSLPRTIAHIRKAGLKQFWHDLQYIGDAKSGTLVGTDSLGNKFYENLNEIPGRHRWVDYKEHDFNAPQIEPIWHSWLHHIRQDPPNRDPIVEASRKTWEIGLVGKGRQLYRNGYLHLLKWSHSECVDYVHDLVSARVIVNCLHDGWEHRDSVTGTRASFRTYSTVRPKINAWEPTVAPRK